MSDHDKLRVIGLISSYTLSEARMAEDARRAMQATGAGARPPSFEQLLRLLVDEDTYPRLHRLAWAPRGGPGDVDERQAFLYGLEIILDGVEALIERSRA